MITTKCPKCSNKIVSQDGLAKCGICSRSSREATLAATYRALWHELHTVVRTMEQYEDWLGRVPKQCGCKGHWGSIAKNPQPHDPWWGFKLHNRVNLRLGKPVMREDEACRTYGWDDWLDNPPV